MQKVVKSFKDYFKSTKKSKKQKKVKYGAGFGLDGAHTSVGSASHNGGAGGGIGESLLRELTITRSQKPKEEEQEKRDKYDDARNLFQMMLHRPDVQRQDIINMFIKRLGVTDSTATSYYQRLAKEAGITGPGQKSDRQAFDDDELKVVGPGYSPETPESPEDETPEVQEWEDPDRQGAIRVIKNAHLVYKRQQEDGTFEEMWIYKIGDDFASEIDVRNDILAGTDIPPNKTKSPDGSQQYTLSTMGDAQILQITGLPQ